MSDGTTTAKHSSNRKNARRSTGPRSVEGKMRASQNAVRHGLARASFSISSDEIEILIRAIIGGACDFRTNALARRFAMAQAQVKRTKSVRDSYTLAFTQALDQGDTRVIADLLGRFSGLERYERAALAQRRFAVRDLAAVSTSVLAAGFLQNEAKIAEEDQQVYSPACEAPAGRLAQSAAEVASDEPAGTGPKGATSSSSSARATSPFRSASWAVRAAAE